jgi:hypothetical protein
MSWRDGARCLQSGVRSEQLIFSAAAGGARKPGSMGFSSPRDLTYVADGAGRDGYFAELKKKLRSNSLRFHAA